MSSWLCPCGAHLSDVSPTNSWWFVHENDLPEWTAGELDDRDVGRPHLPSVFLSAEECPECGRLFTRNPKTGEVSIFARENGASLREIRRVDRSLPSTPPPPVCPRCSVGDLHRADNNPPQCSSCGAWIYPDDPDYPRVWR